MDERAHAQAERVIAVNDRLSDAVRHLASLKLLRSPNQPIDGYNLPPEVLIDSFIDRLERSNSSLLVFEAASMIDSLVVPQIVGDPPNQEHLAIYDQVTLTRAALQAVGDKAVVAGYGHLGVLSVPKSEVNEEIGRLAAAIEQLTQEVTRARKPGFGGISVALGPVSIDLDAIQALLGEASTILQRDRDQVDAGAVWSTVSKLNLIALRLQVQLQSLGWSLSEAVTDLLGAIVGLVADMVVAAREILVVAVNRQRIEAASKVRSSISRGPKPPRFDLAIDLGCSTTRIWQRGKGIVFEAPSLVAVRKTPRGKVLHAAGSEVPAMLDRTPQNIETIWPIERGGAVNLDWAQQMLRHFLRQVDLGVRLNRPKALVTVKARGPEVHRRSIREVCEGAGLPRCELIDRGLAAAIGAHLPISSHEASMIIDVGMGTTDVAILADSAVIAARTLSFAGRDMNNALEAYLRRHHNLLAGGSALERLKVQVLEKFEGEGVIFAGRDLMQGVPRQARVTPEQLAEALETVAEQIALGVRDCFEAAPMGLRAELTTVHLSGGGALVPAVSAAITRLTGLATSLVVDPLEATIRGCGRFVDQPEGLEAAWRLRE